MPENTLPAEAGLLPVQAEESGMKLLRFLERRLEGRHAGSMLHKWIRTGQVRVNKGRAKPFTVLEEGDVVRVPPFAVSRALDAEPAFPPDGAEAPAAGLSRQRDLGPGARVLGEEDGVLALFKPAGLACQGGSGQSDSLAERLRSAYSGSAFIPAPAHRLDKASSGLVLAGTSHAAQKRLHALFGSGAIFRDYLAWIDGLWEHDRPCLLRDVLRKEADASGRERMVAAPGGSCVPLDDREGSEIPYTRSAPGTALSLALPLRRVVDAAALFAGVCTVAPPRCATLMLVRLITGRTHQIRVQFASRGHALWGDRRYGGPACPAMLLHAAAAGLPEADGPIFFCPPEWPEALMPEKGCVESARAALGGARQRLREQADD